MKRLLLAAAWLLAASSNSGAEEILGQRPDYTAKVPGEVPNATAIGRRIWAPGLDDGFVPQGLTMAGDKLLLVAYRSTKEKPDQGRSRVFEVDPVSGNTTGQFDLPEDIVHPGGLAFADGALFVADGGRLLRVDLRRSLASRRTVVTGQRDVDRAMGPSFLAYFKGDLWFGRFERTAADVRLYAVPVARVFAKDASAPLRPAEATHSIPLPLLAQGATFDNDGQLWLSTSVQREGWLLRVDSATGRVLGRHPMPAGIEDLAHGRDNVLWAAGESGTKRWLGSPMFFPLLFEIHPGRLVADRP